jgi:hypothetical protein
VQAVRTALAEGDALLGLTAALDVR